ncbi:MULTISPECIES: dihydrodipicolinate synthase family protein [unclassified Arenibacter]|jgi:N-acetylneuraminate lyase|uniref:dihydrodipicolinate synthase family protein n=1 Tax=unclassified Arenibacter TaxID=2615047 RepID=UPI000E35350A|nr:MULTISPECIES: dihydrodipicolinate synthase family protein [unclassified Arenibacter]MCM4162971.1 N-acetylneuraminate lyase [Arenibacter sp. A80]RFT57011.1 N-acetylneuraminate lyase [Arenibacter sp. P308M17]
MTISKTKGLIAAPFTGMGVNGSINVKNVSSYADHLKKMGVKGVFVAGTTGEGMLMTDSERLEVIEAWASQKSDDFRIIAHAGSTSIASATLLASESARLGAEAIAIMGPPFLPPKSVADLVGFSKEVAMAAPELPFYYYHIPVLSGVDFPMSQYLEEAKGKIPNLAGIKFTDNNFMEMSKCITMDDGKWDILHGYDELLLAGLSFGAVGAVGSTYNFMAPLYYGIMEDFNNGHMEKAREKQQKSIDLINILIKYKGALVSGKALMGLIGIDCGPCRKPLQTLSNIEIKAFENELRNCGFFEMIDSY